MKSKGTAYLLWFGGIIGFCGLHRLYLGKIGTGLLWLFTFGLLGIGQLVDLFTLGGQVDLVNAKNGAFANAGQNVNTQNVVVNVTAPAPAAAPAAGASALPAAEGQDLIGKLEKLSALLEKGHISQEEYAAEKSRLLSA